MSQSEAQLYNTITDALEFFQSNLHTILIGKVSAVNEKTVDVEPVINRVVSGESVKLPVFPEVPPVFLNGGTSSETWPIAVGDYALLFVTERAYDFWFDGQDFRSPIEPRMHDYSDCFALVGLKNSAGALTIPSVITRIGDVKHTGNTDQTGNKVQSGDYELNGAMTHNGDLTRTGSRTQTGDDNITGNGTYTGALSAASFGGAGGAPAEAPNGFSSGGVVGVSGSYTTADSKTVTVTNGIITLIV